MALPENIPLPGYDGLYLSIRGISGDDERVTGTGVGCFSKCREYVCVGATICRPSATPSIDKYYEARDKMDHWLSVFNRQIQYTIEAYYLSFIEAMKNTAIVILGDHLENRNKEFTQLTKTRDFVNYLKKNNIGTIISSPLVMNPAHPERQYFCQAWMWIPPNQAKLALPLKAYVHNEQAMNPSEIHKWNRYGLMYDYARDNYTTQEVERAVLWDGVDESNIDWGTLSEKRSQR